MRRCLGIVLVGALAAAFTGAARADDAARPVIDKAINAAGGEEKLAKAKAQTWKEKGTFYGMGAGLPYTGTYALQWPDRFRMDIQDVFIIVLNGDKGWMRNQGGTQELTGEQLAEQKHRHYAGWVSTVLPLKDPAFTLSPLAETKVGDKAADGVKVSRKDQRDVKLYFDKGTGLLCKNEYRIKDESQGGKEVTMESFFSDYKDVDGVKIPMKIVVKRDGDQYVEAENTDVKLADKLDDSVFAKPDK
jgi:hypothetical protein